MDDDRRHFGLSTTSSSSSSSSSKNTIVDPSIDIEEESEEDDDDLKPEYYVCPFCFEDFDLVGLCCHIDDAHPIDGKSGICPICAKKVGSNMVHIITQHGNILKILYKKKPCSGGYHSTGSLLSKNSEDEYQEPLVDESSCSSSNMSADLLLSSFIYNSSPADETEYLQSSFTTEAKLAENSSDDNMIKRNIHSSPLSNEDLEEKTQRCEFVKGLLYSTILKEDL